MELGKFLRHKYKFRNLDKNRRSEFRIHLELLHHKTNIMGKEKEMVKEILSNTRLIMKHLKIETAKKEEPKKEIKKVLKKISAKRDKK